MADKGTLGKYELRREIGRGAMGVVYEGYDPMIKRVVAIKTIRSDQLIGDESATVIARFRREAQAAGRLSHPNIVSIYDFGEDGGVWFIAMEFVKGRELKEYFESNERFAMPDIVRIMSQMLDALDYSHRQGVIHRDIKPANVYMLNDGTVKVADFGIAHIESSSLTQVGTVLGTPSYMSPEQIMGLPVDGRSDIFSAGVILYQFLTGERPFAGSATTTMQKVLKEDPLPPSTLNVQVLPAMDAVMKKALAKRADDRFQSAREFAVAIRSAAARESVPVPGIEATSADATLISAPPMPVASAPAQAAVPVPPAARIPQSGTVTAPPSPPDAAPPPPPDATPPAVTSARNGKSRLPAIAAIVGVAVIALGIGGWYATQRSAAEAPKSATAPSASNVAAAPTAAAPAASVPTQRDPGAVLISAVGLVDPSDPRYQSDRALLQNDLRADSKSQLVAKAVAMLVDPKSLASNYDWVRDRLLSKSGGFVTTVVREGEPRAGKDGLMSMTTQAVVNVKAVQKSLNQMSRDERVDLIRANGDPKVSVRIGMRDADLPDTPAQPSPIAENILKERIKSFGFRTWSDGGADPGNVPDIVILGEAKIKKLSVRLEASGLIVSKYTLTSWTIKCVDRATGEEIYYNTTLPKGLGSWATEEEAIKAIGARIAEEFSREFFLQHVSVSGRNVTLTVRGLPPTAAENFARELIGLPDVISVAPGAAGIADSYELQLAGTGAAADLVQAGVLAPLNAKLGQRCFSLGGSSVDQVGVVFDKRCTDAAVLQRFETYPPAGLYGAPRGRQTTVIKNPETLRKLTI
ncbi:MAG TPA: serine/threonine-protein kinase [Casimicrobiaceae bacterium]